MRLLLVEDSERLCESLSAGLSRLGYAVDVVHDGTTGLSQARANPYDLVILDLMLPGLDGLAVLEGLRAAGSQTHVLVLTARDTVEDRVRGLRAGADDYLVKPFAFAELAARVQALLRRRYHHKHPTLALGGVTLDPDARAARAGETVLPLSPREFALLEVLAYRRGEVVSRIDLEDALYDQHSLPEGNAVDSAVCRLRAKLAGVPGAPRIDTHRGRGYTLAVDPVAADGA